MRPLEEGDAIGFTNPINCNELAVENTQILKNNLKSLFPFPNQSNEFHHYIPNYVNTASLPFLSSEFNLQTLQQLTNSNRQKMFDQIENENFLWQQNLRNKAIENGKRILWINQIDIWNRLNILTSKPIYGYDCIKVCEIEQPFSALNTTKSWLSFNQKELILPSTVLNPCAGYKERIEYLKDESRFLSENAPLVNEVQSIGAYDRTLII